MLHVMHRVQHLESAQHVLVAQSCPTLCNPRLHCPWDSPGKNTGVGCHFLLQGIFPIQGSNPSLLHCRQILHHLSHQGSPASFIPILSAVEEGGRPAPA